MERRRIPLRAAGALISRRAALPRSLAEWRAELAPRAAFLAQSLVLLLVLLFFWRILSNAIGNLEQQNIASGFGFLNSTAGFAVNQALIPYSEESSYGRLLIVGLLNTLLVSALGIALASVLGFVIGIARLSSNWIVARLAAAYVEIVRNIPLLLQIFFWYFAFLGALPSPRSAAGWMESVYAHNRGIVLPKPVWEEGSALTLQLLLLALILCPLLLRFARWRRETTGSRPAWIQSALIALLLAPLAAFLLTGAPISLDYPELKGFNFEGGITISREFLALLLALSLYTAAYIAEIVRAGLLAVQRGQVEAARAIGLKTPPNAAPCRHPAGDAGDYPAFDEPISQSDEKLVPRRRHRLSRFGLGLCRNSPQPDGTSDRNPLHHNVRLSVAERPDIHRDEPI